MALAVPVLPALAIGAAAFGASELIMYAGKAEERKEAKTLYEKLVEAKEINSQIERMAPKIDNRELVENIKQINETASKIIETVENKPEKAKVMNNFFNYYLPTTLTILLTNSDESIYYELLSSSFIVDAKAPRTLSINMSIIFRYLSSAAVPRKAITDWQTTYFIFSSSSSFVHFASTFML